MFPLVEITAFFMERKRWHYTEIRYVHFKWSFYDHLLIAISTRAIKTKLQGYSSIKIDQYKLSSA